MSTNQRLGDAETIRQHVRQGYGRLAEGSGSCCGASNAADAMARRVGYTEEELRAVPEGANLGVGCGNPTALAELRPGEVVLDLGSGAGFDALLAARRVGPAGRVIGVDMTEAMLARARANAARTGLANVDFRHGTIEALPVEDASVDVILSNCVVNLSPEKQRVFQEAFRVLRPGGRLLVSDLVLERALPEPVAQQLDAWVGCIGGASLRGEYLEALRKAGFESVAVVREARWADSLAADDDQLAELARGYGMAPELAREVLDTVTSIHLRARKPEA